MTKRSLLITSLLALLVCSYFPLSAQNNSSIERGTAIYYADYLAGQRTAYGEIYRPNEMTAAHRDYVPNTLLRVTRLDNQRSVIVRVNDRGPFCEGCVVELSKGAALQLDLVRIGRAPVQVEVVRTPQSPVAAGIAPNSGIALYEQPTYNAPANPNSTYPRPNPDFQSRSIYASPAPSTYSDERPVRINTNPSPGTPTADARRAEELQRTGINAYNQIEAFDSYNYYQAQQAERRTAAPTTPQAETTTYERLLARGLVRGEEEQNNSADFYNRAGVQQPQPQAYGAESVSSARIGVKSVSPSGSYAVQLASYRNFDNAQRQLQKLKQMGLNTAYLLESNSDGGKLYKVLNGPFADKLTAYNELQRYKKDLLLDGIVILLR